jgi:hypothetical protein
VRSAAAIIAATALLSACAPSLQQPPSKQQQVAAIDQGKAAMDAIGQEARQLCTRPDLQAFFSKTPCLPEDTTLEQMADKSRITASEKAALDQVRTEALKMYNKMEQAIQQYYPTNAPAIIARLERARTDGDKLLLEFYDGHITRGEFNTQRKEIAQQLKNDLANPAGPGQGL